MKEPPIIDDRAEQLAAEKAAGLGPAVAMPSDTFAEESVLGALMLDSSKLAEVQSVLRATDFYREANARIFRAIGKVVSKGQPVDIVTVRDTLDAFGDLDRSGGVLYLQQVSEFVPTAANVMHYAKIVREKSLRRDAIRKGVELVRKAFSTDLEEVTADAQKIALTLLSDVRQGNVAHIGDAVGDAIDKMLKPDVGITSGIEDLDWVLCGLVPGTFTVVAADPGMGKTQLAVQYAIRACEKIIASKSEGVVLFISVEMPREDIAQRMVFRTARIDSMEIRRNGGRFLNAAQRDAYKDAAKYIASLPLFIRDQRESSIDAGAIPAIVKQIHMENFNKKTGKGGIEFLVVDYLQAIQPGVDAPYEASEERRVSKVSTMFRDLAIQSHIPILGVSATSRAGELRHSGQINYDAHNIVHIENMEKKKRDPKDTSPTPVIMSVRKQRNGITGDVKASFVKKFGFFAGYEDEEYGCTGKAELGDF